MGVVTAPADDKVPALPFLRARPMTPLVYDKQLFRDLFGAFARNISQSFKGSMGAG